MALIRHGRPFFADGYINGSWTYLWGPAECEGDVIVPQTFLAKAEVRQHDVTLRVQQDVLWLQVPSRSRELPITGPCPRIYDTALSPSLNAASNAHKRSIDVANNALYIHPFSITASTRVGDRREPGVYPRKYMAQGRGRPGEDVSPLQGRTLTLMVTRYRKF